VRTPYRCCCGVEASWSIPVSYISQLNNVVPNFLRIQGYRSLTQLQHHIETTTESRASRSYYRIFALHTDKYELRLLSVVFCTGTATVVFYRMKAPLLVNISPVNTLSLLLYSCRICWTHQDTPITMDEASIFSCDRTKIRTDHDIPYIVASATV
jgi:hypothetical protein